MIITNQKLPKKTKNTSENEIIKIKTCLTTNSRRPPCRLKGHPLQIRQKQD